MLSFFPIDIHGMMQNLMLENYWYLQQLPGLPFSDVVCDHVPEQMDAFIQSVGAVVSLLHFNLVNGS